MIAYGRYVFKQLAVGLLFITAGLTGVIWLSQSLRFVDLIVNRGLDAATFLHLVMLLLPNYLLVVLPIAVFAAVTFTYTRLISDRELMVMSAAGVSPMRLASPAILLAILVSILAYFLYLTILPTSYRQFHEFQWDLRYNFSHVLLEEGAFTDVGEGITVYVRERSADGQLRGIFVHDQRDREEAFTLLAERGALVGAEEGARVMLFQGSRQSVDPRTGSLSILYFERYAFDLDQTRREVAPRYREPRERTLSELLSARDDPSVNPDDYGQFSVEAHRRLTAPLTAVSFTMVAVSCLLTGAFRRYGQYRRVLLAVGIVLALSLATLGIENLASRNTALLPLIYALALGPIIGGALVLLRPWRRRRAGLLAAPGPAAASAG